MRWSEIPADARKYILYHTIGSPLLISWYMLPAYLFLTGHTVLDVGILFTAVNVLSVPLTYLIGRIFDRVAVRQGLILIDALDSLENFLYGISHFLLGPLLIPLGMLVGKISGMFYTLYQVAEKLLYPRKRMEEVYAWHMRLPLLGEALSSIALGYVLGVLFPLPIHYAFGFVLLALGNVLMVAYLARFLPRLDAEERLGDVFTFRFDAEFKAILLLEALETLAILLAPGIVLMNYMMVGLGMSFFHVMAVIGLSTLVSLPATYLSERIPPAHRYRVIASYFALMTAWALIMFLIPDLLAILLAHVLAEFANTLSLPFYRSWLFSKIPSDRASSVLAGLSSFERSVGLVAPLVAGLLATVSPTLPYLVSLVLFLAAVPVLVWQERTRS